MDMDEEIENEVSTKTKEETCPHCGQDMKSEDKDADELGDTIAKAVVDQMKKSGKKLMPKNESDNK